MPFSFYHAAKAFFFVLLIITTAQPSFSASTKDIQTTQVVELKEERPIQPVGSILAADYALKLGRYAEAARFFDKALNQRPDEVFLLENAFKLKLLGGDIPGAVELAGRYKDKGDESDEMGIAVLMAVDTIKREDYSGAIKLLQNMEKKQGAHLEDSLDGILLPYLRAWAYMGSGQPDKAISILAPLSRQKNKENLFSDFQQALIYDLSDDTEKAQLAMERISATPENPYHFIKAAGSFFARHTQEGKALELFKQYRSEHPQNEYFHSDIAAINAHKPLERWVKSTHEGVAEVLMEAARVLAKRHYDTDALGYLRLILHLNPHHPEALWTLAEYYTGEHDYKAAAETYRLIPPSDDFYWKARIGLGESLYRLGKTDAAKQEFFYVGRSLPHDYLAYMALADLLRKDQRYREAIRLYNAGLFRVKQESLLHWSVYFARGICYERLKQWDKAEADLEHALELFPNQPDVLNYLGYSWIDRGLQKERAREMIEKALALHPKAAHIIDSMGWVLFKSGKVDKASLYIERAVEDMPYDPVLNDHLGDIYWAQGRKIEAVNQWRRVLENGGEDSIDIDANAIRKKLEDAKKAYP